MPREQLVEDIRSFAAENTPDALLVFDSGGITGHPDHCRATEAALIAAEQLFVPVLAWAVPTVTAKRLNREFGTAFVGRPTHELDLAVQVDRSRQLAAIRKHASQSTDNPVLWRRLQLLGDTEWLRYLRAPGLSGVTRVAPS